MAKIDTVSFDMILEQILTYTDISRLIEIPGVKEAIQEHQVRANKNLMNIPELYPILCEHFRDDVIQIWENTWKHIHMLKESAGMVCTNIN